MSVRILSISTADWPRNLRKYDNFMFFFLSIFYMFTVSLLSLLSVSYSPVVYLSFCTSALFMDSLSLFFFSDSLETREIYIEKPSNK